MNKRRTKGLFGERSSIGRPLFGRLCSLSRCSVPSALLLLAFALLPCARAWGYWMLDRSDRVLLMNNDTRSTGMVLTQGYYDTNTTSKTYWVHTGSAVPPFPVVVKNLLGGTNHVMYAKDGTKYWELDNCRAGSATVVDDTSRNYIPWSSTAQSIVAPFGVNIPVSSAGAAMVGSVVMRNLDGAVVYSPYYEEGIGTIYFDAVNAFVGFVNTHLVLEIATNVTVTASQEGLSFDSSVSDYGKIDWQQCPFTLFTVEGKTLTEQDTAATNVVLASNSGGASLFYRIRAHLNYRGPIRFRIRRVGAESGSPDAAGLVIIDNIVASYPPMSAVLHRYGEDYDSTLLGAEVLGCIGDFSTPFLAFNEPGIHGCAYVEFLTNTAVNVPVILNNPRMVYRWRYLNQIIGNWTDLAFDSTSVASSSATTSNLVTATEIPLGDGVGDIEYYFTAEMDAPYYEVQDYAFNNIDYNFI